jgi:tyramine---L-glutamate ligase
LKSIAILEYVSGGGFASETIETVSPSLLQEGRAMLEALAEDWGRLPEFSVHVAWDPRVGKWRVPNITVHECDIQKSVFEVWLEIASHVDRVLVIAPELDDQLAKTLCWLRERVPKRVKFLNADHAFSEVASDKFRTAVCFAKSRIRHPETVLLSQVTSKADLPKSPTLKWIVKPRDGAGCESIVRFGSLTDLENIASKFPSFSKNHENWIIQPWLAGESGSVAVLCGPKSRLILPPMTQSITITKSVEVERFEYRGGSGPWSCVPSRTMENFAHSILDSIPGEPCGWIGIDFILGMNECEEKELVAIEVNPRLTTSYLGVRSVLKENLADLLASVSDGERREYTVRNPKTNFTPFGIAGPVGLEFE